MEESDAWLKKCLDTRQKRSSCILSRLQSHRIISDCKRAHTPLEMTHAQRLRQLPSKEQVDAPIFVFSAKIDTRRLAFVDRASLVPCTFR